ncbi:MAG: hypoxanthine phosphoribosyltransferase [Deltaproteobacteria bacterium]|nr:hypoxanthine phosphoribosyltransferase [Deltaproteobacteria bacterium]
MMAVLDRPHELILSESQIEEKVRELGSEITNDYFDKTPIIVGILKGSVTFLADLIRSIDLRLSIDFIAVSSYGSEMKSSEVVKILHDMGTSIQGRDVLLVEDIVDTGLTLAYVVENLSIKHPKSLKICALLDKKEARKPGIELKIDYVGFEVPNKFLVGYGLDYDEYYRNLPFVAAISE